LNYRAQGTTPPAGVRECHARLAWSWLGLVGGPLMIISGTVVMFGGNPATATL
jgi:uncharacterized membrane protein